MMRCHNHNKHNVLPHNMTKTSVIADLGLCVCRGFVSKLCYLKDATGTPPTHLPIFLRI